MTAGDFSISAFAASRLFGHLLALFTIVIWGTTYISTKVLLTGFEPTEILIIRFIMGFVILFFLHPHILKPQGWKREILFALAGLSGITLYYLLENIALVYTQASNVGVIICVAPLFFLCDDRSARASGTFGVDRCRDHTRRSDRTLMIRNYIKKDTKGILYDILNA